MFLKILLGQDVKKVKMPSDLSDFNKFKEFIAGMMKINPNEISMSFTDLEDEETQIETVHDLEYFSENFKDENFAVLELKKINSVKDSDSEEEPDNYFDEQEDHQESEDEKNSEDFVVTDRNETFMEVDESQTINDYQPDLSQQKLIEEVEVHPD